MAFLKLPFKILLFAFLLFVFVALAQWLFFAYILASDSPPQRSELIVVFPGEKERMEEALHLVEIGQGEHLAVINKTRKRLKKEIKDNNTGNGNKAILLTGEESRSTFEDVLRASQLIRRHNFRTITLVTSTYHMPRSLFLFKAHLLGSGLRAELRYHAVAIDPDTPLPALIGLFYNETIKIWGSTFELIGNRITGKLMYDLAWFDSISKIAHTFILIKG